jgi:hypothetical protein
MIPLLYLPAAKASWWALLVLVFTYTFFYSFNDVVFLVFSQYSIAFSKIGKLKRYIHVLSGGTIMMCGIGMVFVGW